MAAEQSNKLGSHVEMKKVWELLVIIVVTALYGTYPPRALVLMG